MLSNFLKISTCIDLSTRHINRVKYPLFTITDIYNLLIYFQYQVNLNLGPVTRSRGLGLKSYRKDIGTTNVVKDRLQTWSVVQFQ